MTTFNVLENHKVTNSFTVEGDLITAGEAPEFIVEYAARKATYGGTVEEYALNSCGNVGNMMSLDRMGSGYVVKQN